MTAETITSRIWTAIADRKLRPGVRLKEEELAEIFSVSRARIRQALALLEKDGLITIVPNRGAFVAEPSIAEARDVFFVRSIIEERLVEQLCKTIDEAAVARLQAHVNDERQAHREGNATAVVRLSGGFHLLLAELSGSKLIMEILRELVSRTSLITAMYQPNMIHSCGPDEHEGIISMISRNDAEGARQLMSAHLTHIENMLNLYETRPASLDLRSALT
jgi:DNA-binding GntR family transcriptional regulator